jgi:beta-lactamase class A
MRYVPVQRSLQQHSQSRPKKAKIVKFTIAGITVVAISLITASIINSSHDSAQAKKATKPASLSANTVATMRTAIEDEIAQNKTTEISVTIVDLVSNDTYHYGSNGTYLGASVNKLVTATLYLHLVDQNKASLYTTIDGQKASPLLTKMIENSDNAAWVSLNHYLTASALNSWAAQNNWQSYNYDTNSFSSSDAAKLLASLYSGKLLSTTSKDILLGHMKHANETNLIVSNVPKENTVYHKAGWLNDHVHDAAIIDNGVRPYVLVIFTEAPDLYQSETVDSIFQVITNASLTAFSNNL